MPTSSSPATARSAPARSCGLCTTTGAGWPRRCPSTAWRGATRWRAPWRSRARASSPPMRSGRTRSGSTSMWLRWPVSSTASDPCRPPRSRVRERLTAWRGWPASSGSRDGAPTEAAGHGYVLRQGVDERYGMRVLVTGAAGHLGEALMRVLPGEGHAVHGLDVKPGPFVDLVGSVADPELVREAADGVDAIIHAATL